MLICDEAVASLEVSIQAQVLNLMSHIREETGVTYLFISHDLAVVRQCSRHLYTKQLLAAIPRAGWRPTASSKAGER